MEFCDCFGDYHCICNRGHDDDGKRAQNRKAVKCEAFGNESLKEKLSNYLLVAVLQAMLAVCRGISLKQIFKLLIGGNTASNACSIQGYKYDNLMYECITYYIYAYQLRCTKQDVLRTLI